MNKHLVVISIGRVSQMLIMFLTYRVLSSVLSVSDMGVYYFLLSISAAFGLIYANPIGMYANRLLHAWRDHGVVLQNLKAIIWSFVFGSLLTVPFLFLFKDKISLESQNIFFIVGVLVFYVFSTSINGTLVPSLNLLGLTNQFVAWTLITNVLGLILSYILVVFVSPHPLNWLIGQGISFTLCGVVAYFILARRHKNNELASVDVLNERVKRVSIFALPIVVTNLAVWTLGQSFRFFYKDNIDLNLLGELAFGLGLATSLCVAVEYLFQQLYFPDFYKDINDPSIDNEVVWNRLFKKLIGPYIYLTFFIIGLSPFILRVLADVKFKNSVKFLAIGALVEFFRMIGNIFNMATQSEMKTHKAMLPYLSGGAVTLVSVLLICKNPSWVNFTPLALIAGHLTAMIMLAKNVNKMFTLQFDPKMFFKSVIPSLFFLSALFFASFSHSLLISILINAVYSLFFAFLLYKSYEKARVG